MCYEVQTVVVFHCTGRINIKIGTNHDQTHMLLGKSPKICLICFYILFEGKVCSSVRSVLCRNWIGLEDNRVCQQTPQSSDLASYRPFMLYVYYELF